jgi:hypothetical protein
VASVSVRPKSSEQPASLPSDPAAAAAQRAAEEQTEEAQVLALKAGTKLIKWIPWPEAPEEQWVPIRTCSIPELDSAYLFAHGKCAQLNRVGDEKLFERWEQLAILSHALRDGLAFQKGIDPTGEIILDYHKQNFDTPLFTSPDNVRTSLRDLGALHELISYYWNLSREVAPLSTYKRLARDGEFDRLVKLLKKKPGPIDLEGFSESELGDLIIFLVRSYPAGQDGDSPA